MEHINIIISVAVIAYNSEATIARCINSLLKQSFLDFELLLLNDGSTDRTLEIMREYADLDARITVITRHNLGVSLSRQEAIDRAHGRYTIFVDADDWVEPDFLEALYSTALESQADMVMCDMLVERIGKTEYLCEKPKSSDAATILGQMIKELHGSLCNKLIAKSAYKKTGVRFLPGLNCCEDQYVVIALLSNNISVGYINRALYHYDKTANQSSITNNWLDFPVEKRLHFIKSIEPFIITEYQKKQYYNYVGSVAYTATASPKSACPNYTQLFHELWPYIKQSKLPQYKKIICYFRLKGIWVPTRLVKISRRYIYNLTHKNTHA